MSDTKPCPVVTAEVVVFTIRDGRLKLLLVQRGQGPHQGTWALPGERVGVDEELDQTATQALVAQTGVSGVYLEQLYTFGRPGRDPRGRIITVAYYALTPSERFRLRAARDVQAVGWFDLDEAADLAFHHAEILATAHERLVAKLDYSTLAFQFMPEVFTLSELQAVYETIRREGLDKRNFRKWVLAQARIEETGEVRREGSHRPARLYRVKNPGKVEIIKQDRPGGARGQPGRRLNAQLPRAGQEADPSARLRG